MTKSTETKGTRFRFVKWGFLFTIAMIGLLTTLIIGLNIYSAWLNHASRLPEALRAEPPAIVQLQRQMTRMQPVFTPSPSRADTQTSPSTPTDPGSIGHGLNDDRWIMDYQLTFRELGVPVTPEKATWLRSHAELLDQLRNLLRDESRGQMEALFVKLQIPGSGNRFLGAWTRLMDDAAQLALQEGNYANAQTDFLNALRLLDWGLQAGESRAIIMDNLYITCLHLVNGLETPGWPVAQWDGIPEALEELDTKVFDLSGIQTELVDEYHDQRRSLIAKLDGPWNSSIFGWVNIHGSEYYKPTGFYLPNTTEEIALPRLLKLRDVATKAIANKRHSADALKQFDEAWQRMIERSRLTFSERITTMEQNGEWPVVGRGSFIHDWFGCSSNAQMAVQNLTLYETLMHLVRVGVLWRQNPRQAQALRSEDLRSRPHQPWRDPFSEQPLQFDEMSSHTLIFSLGYSLNAEGGRRSLNTHIELPIEPEVHQE